MAYLIDTNIIIYYFNGLTDNDYYQDQISPLNTYLS